MALRAGICKNADSVRTPYAVNRAPQNGQGKATGLVTFAELSADWGRSASSSAEKHIHAYASLQNEKRICSDSDAACGCSGPLVDAAVPVEGNA